MLISTKPDTKGKEAVLFRSRQLTEFKWTPAGDIPVYTKETGKTKLPAGVEQTGMLYSSTEPTDKFICENISFETFLSIIANPDSALYHKDLNGHHNSWAYFGIVCNGLVRYALNIKRRFNTKRWLSVPGVRKIADAGNYTAEEIVLCDMLHAYGNGESHVALITDILRDETGKICQIEVSEATRPTCKRAQYDLETFFEKFKLYSICRYDYIDSVPMPDEKQNQCLLQGVPDLPVIAVDYGNKTNYRTNEEVVISVFADTENEIAICRGDEVLENITIAGKGNVLRHFDRGYYTVRHINTGEYVEFCVTEPQITYKIENGMLTVKADPCDTESKITHMEFRELSRGAATNTTLKDSENSVVEFYNPNCAGLAKVEELTDEEKKVGVFTREIPSDAKNFKIYFENKYGIWTHTMIKI